MEERFDELKTRLAEIHDLHRALEMLFWDQTVMMPPGGGPVRAQQLTTLERIAHEKFVADEVGVLDHLASFFKRPLGSEKHDFFQQFSQLLKWAEEKMNRQGERETRRQGDQK